MDCIVLCFVLLLSARSADVSAEPWVSASTGEVIPVEDLSRSSLVRVGPDHGILVNTDGLTAVRSDVLPKQPALRAAMQAAHEARRTPRAPCPSLFGSASSTDACRAWCGQVLPTATARTRGSCTDGIQCQCQAADGQVYASCRMICSAEATSTSTTQGITTTTTTTERQKAPAANIPAFRQLLYDTRVFVDFLTQVEVFFVAVELVRRLNLLVQETCTGSDAAGDACRPWSLVLPPWCFVPLWYVEPSNTTRWEALFDMEKLPSEVHVQEFSKQRVDLGVVPVEIGSRQASKMKDGLGDFLGFTKDMQMCDANGQQAPEAGSTRGSVVYAGYCDSDITVNSLKCGVLKGGFQVLVDLVQSASKRSSSILLKHLDGLQLHKVEGFAAGLPALTPSRALQRSAELFRESSAALGSLPYLAVHLDTHDIAHKDTAPSAAAAAARINRVLKKKKLEQVFVAGSLREGFQTELRSLVKEALYFSQDDGADRLQHRGEEELVELQLCSKAEYFIGSGGSSAFSAAVRRQRRLVRKAFMIFAHAHMLNVQFNLNRLQSDVR